MTDHIITLKDFRHVGICPRARYWFDRHGLDWRDFKHNGIAASKLRATGDCLDMIEMLEESAKRRGK